MHTILICTAKVNFSNQIAKQNLGKVCVYPYFFMKRYKNALQTNGMHLYEYMIS